MTIIVTIIRHEAAFITHIDLFCVGRLLSRRFGQDIKTKGKLCFMLMLVAVVAVVVDDGGGGGAASYGPTHDPWDYGMPGSRVPVTTQTQMPS
jgi:hypothetical protein